MTAARGAAPHRLLVALRLLTLFAFAVACGLAVHRCQRTPAQHELERYVETDLPVLFSVERPIDAQIARLDQPAGLTAAQARALLVDQIIPGLIELRRQAAALQLTTKDARLLADEYVAVTNQLIDACSACVRIIDDPKLPAGAGLVIVREKFRDVRAAYQTWDLDVRKACVQHRLAPPPR